MEIPLESILNKDDKILIDAQASSEQHPRLPETGFQGQYGRGEGTLELKVRRISSKDRAS
jgi:hypothetical protein